MNIAVVGRVVLAGVFVIAGLSHVPAYQPLKAAMAARGVPFPGPALVIGTLFQITAGLMLAFGWCRAPASVGLVLFTLSSSVIMLDFWNQTGMDREHALGAFLSNVALCGGLLVAGFTS